jgi:mono/diheme cytochrome c family protein
MRHGIPAAVALLLLAALPAAAQQRPAAGQAEQGKRLAEAYCSRCHTMVPDAGSWTDAPTFEAIAADAKKTRAWFKAFLAKPHTNMLNTERTPAEAEAIGAYVASLRAK